MLAKDFISLAQKISPDHKLDTLFDGDGSGAVGMRSSSKEIEVLFGDYGTLNLTQLVGTCKFFPNAEINADCCQHVEQDGVCWIDIQSH